MACRWTRLSKLLVDLTAILVSLETELLLASQLEVKEPLLSTQGCLSLTIDLRSQRRLQASCRYQASANRNNPPPSTPGQPNKFKPATNKNSWRS